MGLEVALLEGMLDLRRYTWVDRGEIQHVAATDEATQSLQASQQHAFGPLKTKVHKIIVSKKKETNNFPGNLYFFIYVTVENQTSAHIIALRQLFFDDKSY